MRSPGGCNRRPCGPLREVGLLASRTGIATGPHPAGALGNGFCRAAAQPVPGCQRLAHPHINEDCAVCEPGYCLDSNHKCLPVEAQPAGDLCGDRCFGQALRPDGFDCAAWPMATMAPSDDEPAGRPEHRHLLRCSAPGVCFQCHDTCDECAGPGPKDCTACPAGHFLLAHGAKDFPQARVHVGTCIRGHNAQGDPAAPAGCPATTVNTGQDVCVACRQDCLTCDPANPGHCLSCMRGFFAWPDGTCSATCPEGMVKDSLAGRCVHCTVDHCTRCVTDNPGVCIACHADRPILFHNQCVDSCPPGYRRSGTACLPCKANCLECDGGPDSCSTCRSGFFLRNDTCHSECGCTHFWDEDTPGAEPGCRICSAACHTCAIRATNCVTCLPGMMLVLPRHAHEDHQCAATCPAGWYKSGSLCKPCTDPKCVGCYGGGNTCHTCAHAHAAFERRECFNPCPEGYYKYDKACLKCGGGCGTCYNGLGIGCITCRVDPNTRIPLVKRMQPGTFDHTLNAQCVSFTTIQAGWGLYFQDQKNHYTVPCPENCAACFVDHPHDPELRTLQCTECASGFVLADDRQTCVRPDAEDSSA
ncbi:hypothetical protein H696_00021 [Fonticula alba]|uniref:EGF-like domain-containing protein n=1 Tax=Fonticula alba TaxID=691883 RepID=A0A058ZDG1_FONAL|nr:hypothetical protein H696_00021 [Fonticula alba]KCV72434.1 hypothetical protein H696_00021 [Fonticula alba]|eukprot:XP_009492135.1 hypothetical protein H696_00021 [Fonticula alba]